ncbi:MAG: bacteriocin ABC transporter ATP-binding protein [Chloroflexi bacterium]|nr:MAG: bacteriocin ABC transporter ATP-binding protein [Chloroflexota bacterium]
MPPVRETTAAIELDHLVKRFPHSSQNAVDDISLCVHSGETFGVLGPNGAGKSTTIGILTTLVRPTSGRASICGIDVVADPIGARQRIAVVPQRNNLDRTLRVREILTFHAAYHGVPRNIRDARADQLLEEFGLSARRNEKLGLISGGMEQRLMVARALMNEPEVLFLDEPTNNLDPQSRRFLWERIRALHERGVTIVLTTHDMEEADQLCERIAIMDHGRILALDTPAQLKRLIPGGTLLQLRIGLPLAVPSGHYAGSATSAPDSERVREALARLPGVTDIVAVSEESDPAINSESATFDLQLTSNSDAGELIAGAVREVVAVEGRLLDLRFAQPSLEDVFIYLTGRKLRS